jgi:hypothetical protein
MKSTRKNFQILAVLVVGTAIILSQTARASDETLIKDRRPFGKTIRTRMPPQILIDVLQNDFNNMSIEWSTFWQNFVIEDDENKDEFVIIARSVPKLWAFGVLKEDCAKPENFEDLKKSVEKGGTPVRMDVLVGIRKKRSFFRYVITVYEPMHLFGRNPCYVWNLPPGKSGDKFYRENYTMEAYSKNLKKQVYDLVSRYSDWRPPKKVKKIPAIKGPGQELIGGEAEELTDEEKKLPLKEQEKILKERRKSDSKSDSKKK